MTSLSIIFQRLRHFVLITLFANICLTNITIAQANNNAALQTAFVNMHIVMRDTDGKNIIPWGNTEWRIVQAENNLEALGASKHLVDGITDKNGESRLTVKQGAAIFAAWQSTPNQLWFISGLKTRMLIPHKVQGRYQIDFVEPVYKADQERNEAKKKEDSDRKTPLELTSYTQKGFKPKFFVDDFENWRERFKQDIATYKTKMHEDTEYGRKLLEDGQLEALKKSFSQSIHVGAKGLAFRQELINASYSRSRDVWPVGATAAFLLLSENTKPIGFGGTFFDEGQSVELWYVVFDDMTNWSMKDFKESVNFSAFSPTELPPYNVIKRNSWPALVFTRDADGKIKLYGMSMEMSRIIQAIFRAQIS